MKKKKERDRKIKASLAKLREELEHLEATKHTVLERTESSIYACTTTIDELKSMIVTCEFKDDKDEIQFFKEHKPTFLSHLIYFLTIYNIESSRPVGAANLQRTYLKEELCKLNDYYVEIAEFYRYYRTGSTYLDHKYFLRGQQDIRLNLEAHFFESDPDFSTGHDSIVSRILAYEQVQLYIEEELIKLEPYHQTSQSYSYQKSLTWTANKTALTELMYGLYASGVFNNGNAEIKTIASHFEKCFNTKLGKYYRIYSEMRMRHERTKFLDDLRDSLERKMQNDDEK